MSDVYRKDIQLSTLLDELGFSNAQIEIIRSRYLDQTSLLIQETLKEFIFVRLDAELLWQILCKRYGLTGEAPKTLKDLRDELNITRERVRHLEEKAIRKLILARKKNFLHERLKLQVAELLDFLPVESPVLNLSPIDPRSKEYLKTVKVPEYVLVQRKTHPRAYEPWTEEEQRFLEVQFKQGKTVKQLSDLFQRNSGAILSRLRKMGLTAGELKKS